MELVRIYVFGLLTLFSACNNKSEFIITIKANNTNYDTLFIQELISGRTMAKVPLNSLNKNYTFNIDETKLALLSLSGTESTYMAIIRPGVKKIIIIDSTFIKTKKSIPDSLINYFASSTNQLLSEYSDFIFTKDNPEKVKFIFDSLVQVRNKILNTYKSQLTADEFGILEYQNRARANSFLFYFGRILKKYTPDNKFFDFINNIDNENIYSKSLPDNLLYKYEIQILRERDTIENVDVFIKFIEEKTKSKNLQDYLKAIYLKSVIESPSYWRRHEKLFTINTINDALQRESDNEYTYLIKSASNSLYASQKGVKGYDFNAFKSNGTKFNLSDLKGKMVIMDIWATWCGPCISQRPFIIELAKKYKDSPDVIFLLVSVDKSVENWKKYVLQTNGNQYGIEVNIPDGMNGEFGDKYLIKAIPKYFLIDNDGIIVDSNLPEPSLGMEQMIESLSHKFIR